MNNGLSGKMGLELSRRIDKICMDGEEREYIRDVMQAQKYDEAWRVGREE